MLHLSRCVYALSVSIALAQSPLELNQLAQQYRVEGKLTQAEQCLQRALEMRAGQPEDRLVAALLLNLGQVYTMEARYGEAAAVLKRSMSIAEKQGDVALQAQILNDRGDLARLNGRFPEAEALLERSRQLAAPGSSDRAAALHNLALVYKMTGRYAEAVPLLRQALAIWQDSPGQFQPQIIAAWNSLAELRVNQEHYREAETYFTRALDLAVQRFGDGHPDVGAILVNRSLVLDHQRRYGQAEADLRRAL